MIWSVEKLEIYLWVQSQGYHTIDHLEKRGVKEEALDDLPWKDGRGPSSVRQTLELFQRQRWGNLWETGWSAYGLFWTHRYHLELMCILGCSCWIGGRGWGNLNWLLWLDVCVLMKVVDVFSRSGKECQFEGKTSRGKNEKVVLSLFVLIWDVCVCVWPCVCLRQQIYCHEQCVRVTWRKFPSTKSMDE